jgi:peptidase M23-like protein/transglycosylase-like protein with SLT domain
VASNFAQKLSTDRRRARRHHKHHHRHHRGHRFEHTQRLRLSHAGVKRTGGTLWVRHTRRLRAFVAPITAVPASVTPITALDANLPVVLPAGLSAQLATPPAFLTPIYKQAARRYHVPWRILAAINSIETNYGHDLSVSPAGAIGWMQFMPDTWRMYGRGGNPYDPRDAIFAAARLLHAAGASHDLRGAVFAYNHAEWYVAAVLWRASTIAVRGRAADSRGGYSLPLDARYMHELGRTDDGVDIESVPDGAAVYSITPGLVVAVASDPTGFGPNYPVVLATAGPLVGHYIYYGHVAASLVHTGQEVLAGQPIAIVGHTGDAAGLGHGHIEIGFSDSSGDPLNHHGAQAWTPSGQVMRSVLVTLSARFGVASD